MEPAVLQEELTKAANEIQVKVKGLTDPLNARLAQIEGQLKEGGEKVDPLLKSEVTNLAQKHEAFVKLMDEKLANLKSLRNAPELPQSFIGEVKSAFNQKSKDGELSIAEQVKDIARRKAFKSGELEINLKAVGDMSVGVNATSTYFSGYDQRPGVLVRPLYDQHLRPFFSQNTTEKNLIRYVRESGTQGGPDMTAEGATKPQMDFSFLEVDASVRKVAGYFRISEEMIDDIPYLLTYLTGRGMESLKNVEDYQILHGDGTGQNLAGLDSVAVAFAAGGSSNIVTAPNEADVLIWAKRQLRNNYMMPKVIMVHPDNYAKMRTRKTTTNEPLFPYLENMQTISIDGTPIIQNTRVVADNFYVVDTDWIEIVDRMQSQIRLFDQDRDNAIKNMVTCVIEERLALLTYRAESVIKGTFTAGITDLTS